MIRKTTFMTGNLCLLCIRHVIRIWSKDFKRWSRLIIWIQAVSFDSQNFDSKVLTVRLETRLRPTKGTSILLLKSMILLLSWDIWIVVLVLPLRSLVIRSRSSESPIATSEAASQILPANSAWKNWVLTTVLRKRAPLVLLFEFSKIVKFNRWGSV